MMVPKYLPNIFKNIIPQKFYDNLDPTYREELTKLVKQIEEVKKKKRKGSDKTVLSLLDEFSSKYLMPKELWNLKFKMIKRFNNYDKFRFANEYCYHLCYLIKQQHEELNVSYIHTKLYSSNENEFPDAEEVSVDDFCYPHQDFEEKWKYYERKFAESIIPRAIYRRNEKLKNISLKLLSAKKSTEWFLALLEAEDHEFVVDNVEFRLNQNLGNKKLWKLYIQFLQNNNHHKKFLDTYSKYVRFFIGDSEMLKEYQKAAEKYGPSIVQWQNAKTFEIYDEKFFDISSSTATASVTDSDDDPACRFNPESALPQKLPFRPNLMNYILDNAKASILFDLHKACKWFYCYHPIGIVYKFHASVLSRKNIRNQTINIVNPNRLQMDNKIYISDIFDCFLHDNALSNFLPKIYRCTAKYVIIDVPNLTFEEIKFLIGHGEVIEFVMSVYDENNDPFKFEDIIPFLPKIQALNMCDTVCSSSISQTLCDFLFQNKITNFHFDYVCDDKILPDPYAFAEFMLKNASPSCYSSLFSFRLDKDFVFFDVDIYNKLTDFHEIVDEIIAERWKGPNIPINSCFGKSKWF